LYSPVYEKKRKPVAIKGGGYGMKKISVGRKAETVGSNFVREE